MAIANADGSIVLSTKVDVSGTRQGFKQIVNSARQAGNQTKSALEPLTAIIQKQEKRLQYLNNAYAELIVNGRKNTKQAKRLRDEIDALSKEMKDNQAVASAMGTKGATAFQKMGSALKVAVGYFIGIQTIMSAISFSKEASNLAIEQEASVQRLIDIYGVASDKVGDFIDLNARALGMSKASAVGFSAVYGNLFSVWADQATNAELTNQYLNMTAVIASKTGRTVEDVQERIRSGLLGNTEAIEDLGVFVNVKTIQMTEAFQRIADGRSWEQLTAYEQSQVRTLAILEQSTKKYGNEVADTNALVRAQYLASYQDLQATWGQFVNTVLIPVLRVATKVMDVLTAGMRAIAGLTGKTLENTSASANSISGAVENQEELTDAVKGTNKELKKSLAGFDELNTISQDTGSGSGSGGASVGGASVGVGGGFALGGGGSAVKSEVDSMILSIMGIVGVGLIAIGLILCLNKTTIPLGIGFIVAGAGALGITMATLKSDAVSQKVKDALSNVLIITGIVAIILGILCCIAQKWVVGIGLIVTGATSLVGSVALNRKGIKEQIKGAFGGVLTVVGLVAIIIGILCCTAQHWAIGIGLIVTGALAVGTVVAVNWDIIKEMLQGKLGTALAIVGVVSILLGILCCVAQHWGLGIGMIVAGAVAVGSVVAINWESIETKIKEAVGKATNWVKTWGLLVLGIILVASGVGFGLGLALMKKGAENLTEAKDPKWMSLLDKVKEAWKAIKYYYDTNIAKYLTAEYWAQKGTNMVNGLIRRIVEGLNRLIDKLNTFGFNLPDVLGGGRVGFSISRLNVPQLAKGAVLPPNKPFLAMVGDQKSGTNIEAPLDTIVEAVKIALGGSNGFNGRIEVPVYLGNRQIALAVREGENEMGTETVVGGFANAY